MGQTPPSQIARRIRLEALRARVRAEQTEELPPAEQIAFVPLAAAGADELLPDMLLAHRDPLVSISVVQDSAAIHLSIATQGFARTDALRNRQARIWSENGAIDQMFQFGSDGRAEVKLSKNDAVVAALKSAFTLDVDQ